DGDIDLCIVNYWANMVSVLKNDGSGGFTVSSTVGVGSNVDQVCNADFDNDGDLDLAVTNNGSLYISLLINNGTGAFSSSTIPADGLTGIVPADFDGDGDVDLAVNRFGQHKIAIYKNNGSASFTMFSDFYAGIYPFYITAGDFNNNGIPDIAVTNYYNSMISVLYNLAPPVFISPANNSTGNLSGLNFYWGKSRGASNYRFQLATDSMFSNIIVNDSTLLGTDSIKYVSGLNALTWYFWRMNSKSLNGNSLWSGTWKFKTQGVPTQVVLNTPANNSVNQPLNILFKWFKAYDQTMLVSNSQIPADIIRPAIANTLISNSRITVSNYWFELASDAGFSNIISRDSLLTDTVKSVSGLSIYTTYYWRVKAKNQSGWGVFSPVWSFTTIPPVPIAPLLVSPPNNATNQIPTLLLDWNSVNYASGYRIQIANDSLFSSLVFDTSNVIPDSLRVRNGLLGLNNKYYWRVNASNAGGTGPWSAVWNFRISPTGMFNLSSQIPNGYKLFNNYPNPFNPTTNIKFAIPKPSFVKISVFDITGKEIDVLVNEQLKPGTYDVQWKGSKYSSGVYFYTLTAGDFKETKRMLLIK
ncbi:MAG: T9SS type A sorting domain-containing protein, partial [Ignavibacteria bacterium]|nr:T9SS type A sorting domain-containing protein [Ignavibacteria bacterium]